MCAPKSGPQPFPGAGLGHIGLGPQAATPRGLQRRPRNADRHPREVRRDAGRREVEVVRVPGHQRVVLADPERRARRVRRGRQRRDHPGLDRRCGVPLRPDDQEHGDRVGRVRDLRRRGGEEVPRQHRAAHRPLPQGQAGRLRPPPARDLHRAGEERCRTRCSSRTCGTAPPYPSTRTCRSRRSCSRRRPRRTSCSRSRSVSSAARRTASRAAAASSSTAPPRTRSPPSRRSAPVRTVAT